jgi:hypothetical protein
MTDYIKTQAKLYFCRLQTDPINPLLKEALSSVCLLILMESILGIVS